MTNKKSKPGRKKTLEDPVLLNVKIDRKESDTIKSNAKRSGMSISRFVVSRCIDLPD